MSKREILQFNIENLRSRELDLVRIITGKTLLENMPFSLIIFLLNVLLFLVLLTGNCTLIIFSLLIALEVFLFILFNFYIEFVFYFKTRILLTDYVNSEYTRDCILTFPRAFLANITFLIKDPQNTIISKFDTEIFLGNVSISTYLNVLLTIEDKLGRK
jgi:hypothetical protein